VVRCGGDKQPLQTPSRRDNINTDTNHIIDLFVSLFREREKESVMSRVYATLTSDILRIEKILFNRGVDVGEILMKQARIKDD
jgi:hypothetical protein